MTVAKARLRGLCVSLALIAVSAVAHAAGDAARGRVLANTWCASCHLVGPNGSGKDTAPPFPQIAKQGLPDQDEARAFLAAPHPPMPNFDLSREDIDDIVAYLNSLAGP